jgi:predicted Zn-dependent protease
MAGPPVLSAIAVDALSRVWQWTMAVAPAQTLVQAAPLNTQAWVMLSRVLASTGDNRGALDAAVSGLAMSPRDPDLLRSQAVALDALGSPERQMHFMHFSNFARQMKPPMYGSLAQGPHRCAPESEIWAIPTNC